MTDSFEKKRFRGKQTKTLELKELDKGDEIELSFLVEKEHVLTPTPQVVCGLW